MDLIERWLDAGNSVVVAPGWRDSGPEHWQSQWCSSYPRFLRVAQQDWEEPTAADWVRGLEATIAAAAGRVILVAHSLGCVTASHWAALSQHRSKIAAAMLVAPADVAREDVPASFRSFLPLPIAPLPFQTLLVASDNDHACSLDRASILADTWGGQLHTLAGAGHINVDSGHGDWPEGLKLLRQLLRRTPL
ncbi:hypothetical protein IGB42_00868 [Andreprevotia sp. IGB-42]|uniref:RBBP9/YdeN family alpha/beta hydrolase n=1 Tax=Andreprevotia sp. IGB-42 TaxID=2497473 RepID=UPI001357B4EC|nr:alpha/beta hydrolase [Andreprevotia sp. IGB-42]KAF0814813.1 hypothetical protein IGB42_00868 [Andreprevotia sp. IGB-42]